jgi:uncharacterized membrane protein
MTAITLAYTEMRMSTGDWFLMAFGLLAFAAVLLWLGASFAGSRHTAREGREAPSEESAALHLLDRRLAHGEITAEEHEQLRRVLSGEDSAGADQATVGALP